VAVHGVDQRVALLVQRAEQVAHAREGVAHEGGRLPLGVRARRDLHVEPKSRQACLRQARAGDEPSFGIRFLDQHGGDRGVLPQPLGGEPGGEGGEPRTQFRA